MNRDETHTLFTQGRLAWNVWATGVKKEREQAIEEGVFDKEAWLQKAEAEFSSVEDPHTFERLDLSDYIFPGLVNFSGAVFREVANFKQAEFFGALEVNEARFLEDADFRGAKFHQNVAFKRVLFGGAALFKEASFAGQARFQGSKFSENTSFMGSIFESDARFENVCFKKEAWFGEVQFGGTARFTNSTFCGDMGLKQATFEWLTVFSGVTVKNAADFSAINAYRQTIFSNAKFERQVPCFLQANFREAPRLDNIEIPHFLCGRRRTPPVATKDPCVDDAPATEDPKLDLEELRDRPSNYRALRRLALQAQDYRLAQDCLADEIRSSRLWRNIGTPRSIIGVFYEISSNFGRSLFWPTFWFLAVGCISAGAYLWSTPPVVTERNNAVNAKTYIPVWTDIRLAGNALWGGQPCYSDAVSSSLDASKVVSLGLSEGIRGSTSARKEAVSLAIRNGTFLHGGGEHALNRTLGCLYGFERTYDIGDNFAPNVPFAVTVTSTVQKIASGLLIFLFGLAARNILRMK